MKKIHIVILGFFLSTVFFIGGTLFSNFLIKENKNIEEAKTLKIDKMVVVNEYARKVVEAMFYNDSNRLREYGIMVDPYATFSQSMYENIIRQAHELYRSVGERSIIDLFGYGNHEAILYILKHYGE